MKQVHKNDLISYSVLIVVIFFIVKSSTEEFSYLSIEYWPIIFPQCGGQRQSPITWTYQDLIAGDSNDDLSLFNYGKKPLSARLLNDGHTIKVLFEWNENETPFFSGGILGDNEYVVDSMNFHWNRYRPEGAEHCFTDNCPMEMQLIHYNRNYGSFNNSLNFTDGLVIYSAAIDYSFPKAPRSAPLSYIFKNVELVRTPGSSADIEPFIISNIIGHRTQSSYLVYSGSLTTPPCTENVLWLLSSTTLFINRELIEFFRSTAEFDYGDGHNNRPPQPLNGRNLTFIQGFGDAVI
ncbi:carbonic anhydrase 1-like isoform X2 [Chelonus insularis]|uniref:carbonic anhydrase 1-like isoform X2 n=1 Tax=Chelonus insularis TaxID=460826 RepID=UPI00158E32A0|nr:carbonic anhydrase 1-like isoform X2 [Chelonus insularis]